MISRIAALVVWLSLFIFSSVAPSAAQAPIDPSLPEAPLEHRREMMLFSGYGAVMDPSQPVPPLRTKQKFEMATLMTIDPSLFVRAGLVSAYDKAVGAGPHYGSGAGGFWKLYGYNAGNVATSYFFGEALVPAISHQDPRYFCKCSGSAKSRVWWALRSEVVAYSDRGTTMPNYGSLLGLAMSSALSNAYMPPENVSFGQTMESFAIKQGVKAGLDISREFGGISQLARLVKRH